MKEMEEIERQYNMFVDTGDLKLLFPSMTGTWEKDKRRFTILWQDSQRLLEDAEDFYIDNINTEE
jgi:hypothetical protein